jgi:polysaccharide biosynthesis protein PslG
MRKSTLGVLVGLSICSIAAGADEGKPHRSVTWDNFKTSRPRLKPIGWIATRHARDIESSDWSIGCETLDRDQARFSVYKDYVGELGAKHARLQSGWAKCEKRKGFYNFAWLDECVYGLNEQGVKPWMCLCYGNPIYKSTVQLGSTLAPIVRSEEALAAWLKYVEATVARYKGIVNEWEIWNEPFGQGQDYAIMVLATTERIKRIQPDAVIPVTAITDADRTVVLKALKTANKLDLVDYWVYHPYDRNPDTSYVSVENMKRQLAACSPKYRVYQGEVGCPSALEWTHALALYPWTEYSQAKWNLRRMAGDRVRGIPSSVFTIIDLKYPDLLQSFGLIRSNLLLQFIYKRPAYYAVQHMMSFFDGTVKPVGVLAYESNSPRKLTVAGFEKAGTSVALLWYSDQVPRDELAWDRVDVTLKGVQFTNPVYVEMITGRVYELDKPAWTSADGHTTLPRLPIWDSPVMLAERSQIELRKDAIPRAVIRPKTTQ